MTALDQLVSSYCQLFGYSSCTGLSWMEISFLVAIGAFVLVVGVSIVRRVFTGIRD